MLWHCLLVRPTHLLQRTLRAAEQDTRWLYPARVLAALQAAWRFGTEQVLGLRQYVAVTLAEGLGRRSKGAPLAGQVVDLAGRGNRGVGDPLGLRSSGLSSSRFPLGGCLGFARPVLGRLDEALV